jgi:hypothetical protein
VRQLARRRRTLGFANFSSGKTPEAPRSGLPLWTRTEGGISSAPSPQGGRPIPSGSGTSPLRSSVGPRVVRAARGPRIDDRTFSVRVSTVTASAAHRVHRAGTSVRALPSGLTIARFGAPVVVASPGGAPRGVSSGGLRFTARCAGVERSLDSRFAVGRHRRRAGSPDSDRKRLEGERSPWKDGGHACPQGCAPDRQLGCGAKPRSRRNGTGATTAVTRHGCSRVMFFEGYEPRREDRSRVRRRSKDPRWPRKREKRDEPQDRQRDATSPRAPSGENRRGGEKPRGRHGIGRRGRLATEAGGEPSKARLTRE